MKIGVSTLAAQEENLDNFLDFNSNLNIDYIEILNEYPNKDIDKDLLDSYSFKYTVHSPISDMNIASLNSTIRNASIDEIKRSIDLANEIEGRLVVVHPGTVAFLGRFFKDSVLNLAQNSLKECFEYGKDIGIEVSIENMPNMEGQLYQDANELNSYLEKNNMQMTLDVGHLNTVDRNFLNKIGDLKSNNYYNLINHIHLSDNNSNFDYHWPLGEGDIDFIKVFNIFSNHNYNGIYVIEMNDINSVKKSVDYLRNKNNF
jgi:sugar phosphate isomerase/epimerase